MTRDEVKTRIHADPNPIYSLMAQAKDGKSYVCPYCGNGQGATGDGIRLNEDGYFHCFKCDSKGDAIQLYQQIRGVQDFNTALTEVASLYGVSLDEAKKADPAALTDEEKQRRIDHRAAQDIQAAQRNAAAPECIAYLKERGISPRLAEYFGIGFLADWRHPKTIIEGKTPPPTPRLIIPTGKTSYLARDTRPADQIPADGEKYKKQKVGSIQIFNARAIQTATRPLFIVEGEIDAISFYEVGAQAIGLGSTSNIDRLLQELGRGQRRFREPFVIALDNDEAGQRATEKLAEGLYALNIPYSIANPAGQYKDANEALTKDRRGFYERVRKAERAELDKDTNGAYLETLRRKFRETREPIPTGFSYLDDLLDGGLLTGLYFIGGVSSSGKTAFCMQIIDQVARAGGSCLVFAAEMSRADLVARSISRETVEQSADGYGYFTQRQVQAGYTFADLSERRLDNLDRAYSAYALYADRITIYENNGENMKPSRIRDRIKRYCHLTGEHPVILVDYLQILTPEKDKQEIRNCIDDAIRALKGIATEFSLPIIVISSLNRDNYTAPLNFAAFKESGNIEYGADYLLGLQFSCVHEEAFTAKGTASSTNSALLARLAEEKQKPIREVEITILKQRGGRSSGIVEFDYDPRHNRYVQSQDVDDYLEQNFIDERERGEHRQRLTGHKYTEEDLPKLTAQGQEPQRKFKKGKTL